MIVAFTMEFMLFRVIYLRHLPLNHDLGSMHIRVKKCTNFYSEEFRFGWMVPEDNPKIINDVTFMYLHALQKLVKNIY